MRTTDNSEAKLATWNGIPVADMTRGELIDALSWCAKRLDPRLIGLTDKQIIDQRK